MQVVNYNLIISRANDFVFGCDEQTGRTNYPDTPQEYIEAFEKKGFSWGDGNFIEGVMDGSWCFKSSPRLAAYPAEFVNQMLFEFANPHEKVGYFSESDKQRKLDNCIF